MKRAIRSVLFPLVAAGVGFGLPFLLGRTCLREVYLLGWVTMGGRTLYLCAWAAAILLALLRCRGVSYGLTAGNVTGILVGQLLGDLLVKQGQVSLTPDMMPEQIEHLTAHRGAFIWMLAVLVGLALGAGIALWRRRKP